MSIPPQPQYKICPQCQEPAALHAPQCVKCGHVYRTKFPPPNQTQVFYTTPQPQSQADEQFSFFCRRLNGIAAEPNYGLIVLMWGLTLYALYSSVSSPQDHALGYCMDGIATIIGIGLSYSKNMVNKVNGLIKIVLEVGAFAIGFCEGYTRAHGY